MMYDFDQYLEIDRSNFVRHNPVFLKAVFGKSDLLPFWVADTDFQVLPALKEALEARASTGLFGYETRSRTLKQSLAKWYRHRYDIIINPKKLLFMTSVNSGIAAIIDELTNPGDGVIIQPPVFQAFKGIIDGLGREVINNQLILSNNRYEIDFDDLRIKAQVTSTKILLLCSPHNPVGRVWNKDDLTKIRDICIENDLLLIADEIHGDVVYSPSKYIGMLNIYEQSDKNLIMVSSAGKTFGMPGLVDSFIFTPNPLFHEALKNRIERFHLDKGNAFANVAWQVAYENGSDWLDQMNSYLQANVNYIENFLSNEITQIGLTKPEGTYQIWLNFRRLELSNELLQQFLVQDAGIALNSGYTYGPGGDGFMRMNIASPRKMIEQAMQQLQNAINNLT